MINCERDCFVACGLVAMTVGGMPKLKSDAVAGGNIAGGARKKLERRLGKSIVSQNNFLGIRQNKKLGK